MDAMKKMLLIAGLGLTTTVFAAEPTASTTPQQAKSTSQRTFVLPVNWADTPKLGMVVSIPPAFKPVNAANPDDTSSPLMEYIPESETDANWTQRITISKYIGKSATAQTVIAQLKSLLLEKVTNPKIWIETNSSKPNFQQSILGMRYDFHNKRELMGAQYNSGPFDCVGVQYTIRPMEGIPDDDITRIIDDFFKTNVQVVSFTPV